MRRTVLILLFLTPNLVFAHGVEVSLQVGDEAVVGRASYADGSPMAGATVSLQGAAASPDTAVLGRGTTDPDGRFAFPAPRGGGEFRVSADDGLGHRGVTNFSWHLHEPADTHDHHDVTVEHSHSHSHSQPRWQLWLSGLGYLLGLFGAGAWWFARRTVARAKE